MQDWSESQSLLPCSMCFKKQDAQELHDEAEQPAEEALHRSQVEQLHDSPHFGKS